MAAPLCVTVLAAGKGTRMRNALPKVLHPLAGRTLLEHVLASAAELAPDRTVLVLGPDMDEVAAVAGRSPLAPAIVVQEPQLGTGHALMAARGSLAGASGTVLVLFGDTPLLTGTTLARPGRGTRRRRMPPWRCWACGRPIRQATGGCGVESGRPGRDRRGPPRRSGAEAGRPVQFRRDGVRCGAAAARCSMRCRCGRRTASTT